MNPRFFPESFDKFPSPWNISDWDDRDNVIGQLGFSALHRNQGLKVLEQCLSFAIAIYGDFTLEASSKHAEPSVEADEDYKNVFSDHSTGDTSFFDDDRLKESMPKIQDITWVNLEKELTSKRPFATFSIADSPQNFEVFITETGKQISYAITHDLIEHVVQWFEKVFTSYPVPDADTLDNDRDTFLALLKASAPRLSGRHAARLLGAIWLIDNSSDAHAYFTELENSADLPDVTRDYAAQLRNSIEIENGLNREREDRA